MKLHRNIKILGIYLTAAYSVFVLAETPPQADGASLGSTMRTVSATGTTTNSTPTATTGGMGTTETNPSDVTTMDPMNPARDSRTNGDATMRNDRSRRAMGTTSGTALPESAPNPAY